MICGDDPPASTQGWKYGEVPLRTKVQRIGYRFAGEPMRQTEYFFVRITRRGRSKGRFGWEICRQDNSLVVERSTKTYPTRALALIASAKAASLLALPLTVEEAGKGRGPFGEGA